MTVHHPPSTDAPPPSWWRQRIESFRHAFRGLALLITSQGNFQIHLAAAGVAIGFGLWLGLSASEWLVLVVVIGLVLFAEGANTAIERAVDLAQPEIDPAARNAKDIGAAAVLIAAATAVVVGLILFGPKLLRLMGIGALE